MSTKNNKKSEVHYNISESALIKLYSMIRSAYNGQVCYTEDQLDMANDVIRRMREELTMIEAELDSVSARFQTKDERMFKD